MARIYNNLIELVGNTPLIKINYMADVCKGNVIGKLESFNPAGSVKDRIAMSMIETAEKEGKINKDTVIVEPTSGNTGIGLAWVTAIKGYKLILTMPESMSLERRALLKALGAELVLTEAKLGMKGAIDKAQAIIDENENSYMPQQFMNPANPEIHKKTTALEILKDTDEKVDIFVAGVGTGGTLTGVGTVLKQKNPNVKIVAVEPVDSPVISGGQPGPHKIQGIGAGFIPDNLDMSIIDETIKVSNDDAFKTSKELAKTDGILAGISAGANIFAAIQLAKLEENKDKNIVTIICDTGERYLSTELFTDK